MIEAGKTLNGRYKIHSLLGTGGMASVYLANDLILDRYVAVKILRTDFRQSPDAMRRFRREALSATQLTHPNIVGVYDVGETNGLNYIVMEYVQGTDLKEYVVKNGPLHPIEAVRIMMQIVSAIAAAHQNRIIHRDIKPQNVLIDRNRNAKITDFGIAIALSETSLTQTNTLLGSVHYLSPEQARGGMATVRTDIYALGIVMYELLTGHVPFEGETAVSIALKHFQEPLPRINRVNLTVPQSLENVVLKATAKDPLDRYSSCEEMYQDLSTCLDASRMNETMFHPHVFSGETKVLNPVEVQHKQVATSKEVKVIEMEDDTEEVKVTKKKQKWPWILSVLLLIVTMMGIFVFFGNTPKEIIVPDVTNLTEADARIKLADAKLNITDIIKVKSDEIEEGHVIETNPKAGSSVKEKSSITVKVSSGKDVVTMKNYVNQTYEVARDELRKLGFTVEKKENNSERIEAGKVIEQSIPANQQVTAKDTVITLTVSKGESIVKMADLKGYNLANAVEYANNNGLTLTVNEEESDVTANTVIRQSIAPNTDIKKGAALTIVVSKAKQEYTITRQLTIPYDKNSSNGNTNPNNKVEIYIEDAKNSLNTIYRSLEINQDTTISVTLTFNSKVKEGSYRVVRNGKEISTGKVQ